MAEKDLEKYEGATKHLKMAMIDKNISQVEFAERADMPVQSLYNMLNRNKMKFKQVEAFAEAIGCEVVLRDKETGKIY